MDITQREWARAKDSLVAAVVQLGFPEELGDQIAKLLGSPKAMHRMTVYLCNEKPKTAKMIFDETLAICSEIEAWREKKSSEEANARYNDMRYDGLFSPDDE